MGRRALLLGLTLAAALALALCLLPIDARPTAPVPVGSSGENEPGASASAPHRDSTAGWSASPSLATAPGTPTRSAASASGAASPRVLRGRVTFPGGDPVHGETFLLLLAEPEPPGDSSGLPEGVVLGGEVRRSYAEIRHGLADASRRMKTSSATQPIAEMSVTCGEPFVFTSVPDGPVRVLALHRPDLETHARLVPSDRRVPPPWAPREVRDAPLWRAEACAIEGGADVALELGPPPLLLGRVVTADGAPVTELRFEITGGGGTERERALRTAAWPPRSTQQAPRFACADGGFALDDLAPGRWTLLVVPRDPALRPATARVPVPADGDVTIVCARSIAVAGLVVDAQDAPVAGARVEGHWNENPAVLVARRPKPYLATETDAAGAFRMLVARGAHLRVTARGHAASGPVEIAAGPDELHVKLTVRLRRASRVVGAVTGEAGAKAERVVAAVDAEGFVVSAPVEDDGHFALEDLTPGPWRVLLVPRAGGAFGGLLPHEAARQALRGSAELHAAGRLVDLELVEGATTRVVLAGGE